MDWTTLTSLVEHLAWPITVVVSLLVFRKNISGTFNRLGSFSAGAQGVSINFVEEKIAAAKNLAKGIQPGTQTKSSSIRPQGPYSELKKLEHTLHGRLTEIATKNQIDYNQMNNSELADKLKGVGVISIQDFKLIEAFMEIERAADDSLTYQQLNDIKEVFHEIKFN